MRQLVKEKEYSEFKPVDLVSYPARVEGLVNMIIRRNRKNYFSFDCLILFPKISEKIFYLPFYEISRNQRKKLYVLLIKILLSELTKIILS